MTHSIYVSSSRSLQASDSMDDECCIGPPATKRQENATKGRLLPNQAPYHTKPLHRIVTHPHDVLCVQDSFANKHPGNIILRRIVESNIKRYRSCQTEHKYLCLSYEIKHRPDDFWRDYQDVKSGLMQETPMPSEALAKPLAKGAQIRCVRE